MYSITVLWPLAVTLVWFGCLGLTLSTYLISQIMPGFLTEHPMGRFLQGSTHAFTVFALAFLLFIGTLALYAIMCLEWVNRQLVVTGYTLRPRVGFVPALPIPGLPAVIEPAVDDEAMEEPGDAMAGPGEAMVDPGEVEAAVIGEDDDMAQDTILATLEQHDNWREYLARIVAYEREHPPVGEWGGWEWEDVRVPTVILNQMYLAGIILRVLATNRHKTYRLANPVAIHHALEVTAMPMDTPRPHLADVNAPINVDELFADVVGHDSAKRILRKAIREQKYRLHVLLYGPYGSAKSMMTDEIAALPGGRMYVGGNTTKSGLRDMLVKYQPRFLVVDEIDKCTSIADTDPLIELMQHGTVTILQSRREQKVYLDTRVFANANDPDRIRGALKSRFIVKEIPPYTPEQFVEVARTVLQRKYGMDPRQAQVTAILVSKVSLDPRDAIQIGGLTHDDPSSLIQTIRDLFPHAAKNLAMPRKEG